MRVSPQWLREFVDLKVDDRQLAEDLTLAGVAVESVQQQDGQTIFEMEITTNRVDDMNHYGVARECSAIYNLELQPIIPKLPKLIQPESFPVEILDPALCARYTARAIRDGLDAAGMLEQALDLACDRGMEWQIPRARNNIAVAAIADAATNARAPRCPDRSHGHSPATATTSTTSAIHGCHDANAARAGTYCHRTNCSHVNGIALIRQ